MSTMIPITSDKLIIYQNLHCYKNEIKDEDIVILVSNTNSVSYVVIDREKFIVKYKTRLRFLSRVVSQLSKFVPGIKETDLIIENAFGILDNSEYPKHTYSSIFFIIRNIAGFHYVAQVNVKDHNTDLDKIQISVIFDDKIFDTLNIILEIMSRDSIMFSDTKSKATYDNYLLYIDTNDTGDLKHSQIKGIHVLVSEEEKEEFAEKNNIELPYSKFAVVDIWTGKHEVIMNVPAGAKSVKFSFSTGMGMFSFNE